MESFFCDSLEYAVTMEWTPKLADEFEKRRGYSILPYLPLIGETQTYPANEIPGFTADRENLREQVNADYCETLTQCYCENHLEELEKMARKYGKSIRYQVAYNKPLEAERCALAVEIPENEALGRPAMDSQKIMAAAAHLGRKRRYSFECAAEFGNCYGQNFEDLFWWVKRSLMSGMNAQVLHGASYSGSYKGRYAQQDSLKGVSWPGYEAFARGVSNNWNRTPSEEDARGCLDAIARMNALFRKTAKIDLAFYRNSYRNSGAFSEFGYYDDGGLLTDLGYSYESVTTELLKLPVCRVSDGCLDGKGVGYQGLIIPEISAVSTEFLEIIWKLSDQGLPVIWIGKKPERAQFYSDIHTEERAEKWQNLLEQVWSLEGICHVSAPKEVPSCLKQLGIRPRVQLDGRMRLTTAVREDSDAQVTYFGIYGYQCAQYAPEEPNPEELAVSAIFRKGTVKSTYQRPGKGSGKEVSVNVQGTGTVYQLNPWDGSSRRLAFSEENGRMSGKIFVEEDELVLLALDRSAVLLENRCPEPSASGQAERKIPVFFSGLSLYAFGPETPEEKSFLRSGFSVEKQAEFFFDPAAGNRELKPWSELAPELETFVGRGIYEGSFFLPETDPQMRYELCLGEVCDTFQVFLNDRQTGFPDQVLKTVDVTDFIRPGENHLQVRVTSNLFNLLLKDYQNPMLPFPLPYRAKKYGMYETEGKRIFLYCRNNFSGQVTT